MSAGRRKSRLGARSLAEEYAKGKKKKVSTGPMLAWANPAEINDIAWRTQARIGRDEVSKMYNFGLQNVKNKFKKRKLVCIDQVSFIFWLGCRIFLHLTKKHLVVR
jgi:hypothetical protein